MHTSGPCTAPSLPHRYTLCLCLVLCYLAHLHMPFLSTSHSCGCMRGRSWGERYKDSAWRTYNLQTEAVSQPWSPMSRCSSLVCWRKRTESPILQPCMLTPAEPKKHHRGDRESERWRKRKCGGTLKRWWSRIGGEVNGEDKEVVGGCEGKKGRLKKAW